MSAETEYIIKRGNTKVMKFLIKDDDGIIVANLAAATAVKFQIKKEEKSVVSIISKVLGADVLVNAPSTGYIQVTLSPIETTQDPALYYWALQIEWGAAVIYEVDIKYKGTVTERVRISQHIVI